MKCQILFSGKNKKNINLLSAENAQRGVKVKHHSETHRITSTVAGLGGSVGCAVRLETRRSRVQPPPRSATFFRRD